MMEQPFGGDTLHMPGLSYVCAAAEMSLRTVACSTNKSNDMNRSRGSQLGEEEMR